MYNAHLQYALFYARLEIAGYKGGYFTGGEVVKIEGSVHRYFNMLIFAHHNAHSAVDYAAPFPIYSIELTLDHTCNRA